MQAHARECKENKLEEKNNTYWNNFTVKGASLKEWGMYQDDIHKDD